MLQGRHTQQPTIRQPPMLHPPSAQTAVLLSPFPCPSKSTQLHLWSMGSPRDSEPRPVSQRLLKTPCGCITIQIKCRIRLRLAVPVCHMIRPTGRMIMPPIGTGLAWAGMNRLLMLQLLLCSMSAALLACQMSHKPDQARSRCGPANSVPLQSTQITLSGVRSVILCEAQPFKSTGQLLTCLGMTDSLIS